MMSDELRVERGFHEVYELTAEVLSLRVERDALAARVEALEDCDCVCAPVSSKACQKCGRRGVISHDAWLKIVKDANEAAAARVRVEELEAEKQKAGVAQSAPCEGVTTEGEA